MTLRLTRLSDAIASDKDIVLADLKLKVAVIKDLAAANRDAEIFDNDLGSISYGNTRS